jgi:hypothetical protein
MAKEERVKEAEKRSFYDNIVDKKEVVRAQGSLATGGGEPIPKGHTRTNEHRVLQPRNKDGTFGYNSSAEISRKYDYHGKLGKDRTFPSHISQDVIGFIKKAEDGTIVFKEKDRIVDSQGKRWVASVDMSKEEFRTMLENYLGGGQFKGEEAFASKDPRARFAKAEDKLVAKGAGNSFGVAGKVETFSDTLRKKMASGRKSYYKNKNKTMADMSNFIATKLGKDKDAEAQEKGFARNNAYDKQLADLAQDKDGREKLAKMKMKVAEGKFRTVGSVVKERAKQINMTPDDIYDGIADGTLSVTDLMGITGK